ncbi:MAG: hypothetical protein ACRDBY_06290, partial [Cetobacterium sp.]
NNQNSLKLLSGMIERRKSSKIIFILPENQVYRYRLDSSTKKYTRERELKYILKLVDEVIKDIFGDENIFYKNIQYENTKTQLNSHEIPASFYLEADEKYVILKSIKSKKNVCLKKDNVVITTLQLNNKNMDEFIKFLYPLEKIKKEPEWFTEIEFFDDKENKLKIVEEEKRILDSKRVIEEKEKKLTKNNYYKSILYSNGDYLVEVVFSILKEILNYDLSEFVDNKKEDFLLKFDDITFIGEIKGIGTGVKSGNISQVDRHLQDYFDKLQEKEREENLKGILIINPQRSINPINREKVHETQIKLAERNGCLIILTEDLLKLYEKFLIGEVTTEKILEIFKCETGLFSID